MDSTQRRSLDPYDECYEKVTPRKIDTFSHRKTPCRYESPLFPYEAGRGVACPFMVDGYCRDLMTRGAPQTLQAVLSKAYSERIKNVLSEPSTSVVIRSEQQFHLQDLARFAQRRHFYEVVRNGTPGDESRFGVGCTEINHDDRFGEYLGFVDLRQHYRKSALAFGLLVEPSWIREDPNTFVISGIYGPLFGAHSFRSTVYSMQDPDTIGAKCAHVCGIMALGMLADRGAEVKGSFTLTYLAWQLQRLRGGGPSFEVKGLRPKELCEVLRSCEANSRRIKIECERTGAEDLATRIIEANIYARFPVILAVDAPTWKQEPEAPQEAHSVIMVGVRRNALTNEPFAFIVHDPGSAPFLPMRTERCFAAAKEYKVPTGEGTDDWKPGNAIDIVVAATHSIQRNVDDCIRWLREKDFSEGQNPYSHQGANPETFGSYERRDPGTDYRIRLLNRNTVARLLGPCVAADDSAGKEKIGLSVSQLEDTRFWAIMGFRQIPEGKGLQLSVAWLFDARYWGESAPSAKFWRDKFGALVAWWT